MFGGLFFSGNLFSIEEYHNYLEFVKSQRIKCVNSEKTLSIITAFKILNCSKSFTGFLFIIIRIDFRFRLSKYQYIYFKPVCSYIWFQKTKVGICFFTKCMTVLAIVSCV